MAIVSLMQWLVQYSVVPVLIVFVLMVVATYLPSRKLFRTDMVATEVAKLIQRKADLTAPVPDRLGGRRQTATTGHWRGAGPLSAPV